MPRRRQSALAPLAVLAALALSLIVPGSVAPAAASETACPTLTPNAVATAKLLVRVDPSASLDRCLVAVFEEPTAQRNARASTAPTASAAAQPSTTVPASRAFDLSSRPDSDRTLYLDFTGADLSATTWAQRPGAPSPVVTAAFDADGSPTTFSDAERRSIIDTWAVVSEDFAPFDVNVTTVEPAADALNRSDASDMRFGASMVFTQGNWVGKECGCSGMAPFGTFASSDPDSDAYRTGLAFPGSWASKSPAEFGRAFGSVASHEFGHILGLVHDGLSAANPNGGRREYAAGANGWAPLMGVSGPFELSRWSNGDYDYASSTQDDLAILTKALGTAIDDYADTDSATGGLLGPAVPVVGSLFGGTAATNLTGDGLLTGVLGSRSDVDTFAIQIDRRSTVVIAPTWAGNSDLKVNLLSGRRELASYAPSTTWNAAARLLSGRDVLVTLDPGTYTLRVSADASTGPAQQIASIYGSLGGYTVTVASAPTDAA